MNTDVTERAKLMAGDVDPELRRMFLAQTLNSEPEPSTGSAPLAVDDERYELHQEAKQLAQARCDANPRLDPAEEYADAAARLLDRGGAVI